MLSWNDQGYLDLDLKNEFFIKGSTRGGKLQFLGGSGGRALLNSKNERLAVENCKKKHTHQLLTFMFDETLFIRALVVTKEQK